MGTARPSNICGNCPIARKIKSRVRAVVPIQKSAASLLCTVSGTGDAATLLRTLLFDSRRPGILIDVISGESKISVLNGTKRSANARSHDLELRGSGAESCRPSCIRRSVDNDSLFPYPSLSLSLSLRLSVFQRG
jgi:hypothetical protein